MWDFQVLEQEGVLVGYARVSTEDQSLQMQIDALVKAGVDADMIYSETVSGVSNRRWQLELAIKSCQPGDTLVVWKLDRVGRNLLDLLRKLDKLQENGIGFRSLTEGIDTTTPVGRMMFSFIGALAQFERDLIRERTRAGVRAHIERGGRIGAERKITTKRKEEAIRLFNKGWSVRRVANKFGVKPQTIYQNLPGGPSAYIKKPRKRKK